MINKQRGLLVGVALSTLLTACGNDGNSTPTPTASPSPTAAVPPQERLGAGFLSIFNQGADTEATDPPESAVPPLDLASEPFPG